MQQQWTISPSDYNVWWKVDFIWQPAQWLDREETLKTLPKAKLALKKRSYSLFGGLLPIWSTTAFWIPAKPLYLRSMLSKSMRCTENCNTCKLALVNRMGPILLHSITWPHVTQPKLQNLNELGYEVLPQTPSSPDLFPTDYNFFKHLNNFLQG